jgi:hypothetical protein
MVNKKNLVVITWDGKSKPFDCVFFDANPNFEILLFNHTGESKDSPGENISCDHYISSKTENKGQIFHYINEYLELKNLTFNYIGIIDDDIIFKISDFNYMLHIALQHDLDIFQPSISKDSFFSHRKFVNRSGVMVDYIDWIEIMAPFYKQELFVACKDYFLMTISGQGIDCYLMPVIQKIQNKTKTAVIHAIIIKHYRPIRSHQRIYANGLNNEQEIELIRKEAVKIATAPSVANLFDSKFMRLTLKEGNPLLISLTHKITKITRIIQNSMVLIKERAHY